LSGEAQGFEAWEVHAFASGHAIKNSLKFMASSKLTISKCGRASKGCMFYQVLGIFLNTFKEKKKVLKIERLEVRTNL